MTITEHPIYVLSMLTAFDSDTIGTKVTSRRQFFNLLDKSITEQMIPNVNAMVVDLGEAARPYVSPGSGKRHNESGGIRPPTCYIMREYRGRVEPFLKRQHATVIPGDTPRVLLYTKEAALEDKDIKADPEEWQRIKNTEDGTLIVVAVWYGKAARSAYRFVSGLCGHNNEMAKWDLDTIKKNAPDTKDYEDNWATVAD